MLESVGINQRDENVYRTLLGMPQATIADLCTRLAQDARAVRRSIAELEQAGLVSRIAGRPARLIAARPDVAIDVLVARRQEDLGRLQLEARAMLSEMSATGQHRPDELVEVIVGRQAIGTRFEQLLHSSNHELLVLDRPPYVSDSRRSDIAVRDLLDQQITVRGIYAPESLEIPGALAEARDLARAGEQARVHPDVPMKLAIADRSLALLPLAVERMADTALGIHPSALLDALVQLFELLWQQAIPLVTGERTQAGADPAVSDEQLLPLLVAGIKDDAIARQLGVSSRTVSRRVAELMDVLHARTRFQAGIQAVRLGWLDTHSRTQAEGRG